MKLSLSYQKKKEISYNVRNLIALFNHVKLIFTYAHGKPMYIVK